MNAVYRQLLTPLSFLQRSQLMFSEKTAVVHGERRYTYQEFARRIYQFASRLQREGLKKGDRVAFLTPNIPALLEAHYAVPAAGGILVPINTRLQKGEVDFILRHSGASWLFVDAELLPLISSLQMEDVKVIQIDDTGEAEDPYEQFLAGGLPEPVESELEHEEETISINYTSGTTGDPKGVMYTYRGVYLNALGEVIETGLNDRSVYLWTLPMFHCNGWCFTWAVTAVGGTHVCLRQLDADRIWDLFEREGITHYNGAPTVQGMLVNHPKARPMERAVTATVAGAPPSPTLLRQMKELNIHPIHVYGLTETYGPHTICRWQSHWSILPVDEQGRRMSRQGQAYVTGKGVRVVDHEMQDVPQDGQTIGEVVMQGNLVAKGYYNNPEATEKAFAGGWFHSGDLGVWYPDGSIELKDRSKDVIISGGENISSIEVEHVIAQHPAVSEVAVVAIPHEKWGERPKAFVSLKRGEEVTARELIQFCRDRLAHFKCPDQVKFGELPKTSTGKVQKFVLREREWAQQVNRIH